MIARVFNDPDHGDSDQTSGISTTWTKYGIYRYILRYTQLYYFRGTCTMLWYNQALNRTSRYIPVYTFTRKYVRVCTVTSMYNLRKLYTLMYQNGYVRTIHGTYEYMQVHRSIGFRTLYKMQYNIVHHCLFKYEIFHSSTFGYMRVHHWLPFLFPTAAAPRAGGLA